MKKLIGLVLGMLMVLSALALADKVPCNGGDNCKNEQNIKCTDEELKEGKCRKEVSGGGSFALKYGSSLFGLQSNYDGYGWGTVLPKKVFVNTLLRNYRGDFRGMKIIPDPLAEFRKKGFNAVHMKIVTETDPSMEIYEILSNADVKGYVFYVRVPMFSKPKFYLITDNADITLEGKLQYSDHNQDKSYYAVESWSPGILVVKHK